MVPETGYALRSIHWTIIGGTYVLIYLQDHRDVIVAEIVKKHIEVCDFGAAISSETSSNEQSLGLYVADVQIISVLTPFLCSVFGTKLT